MLEEEKKGRLFSIPLQLFFVPNRKDPFRMYRYGRLLETPVGVAAGPHTQLAQNIISAWLTGARYIELKTVQTLDEIEVRRPCIDMEEEGYNCEWSQELKLRDSFREYLNAWILLHLLKDRFGWGERGEPGFIFNMSVGYDLAGIQKPNVQQFLDSMTDAGVDFDQQIEAVAEIYPAITDIDVRNKISDNVTLSTMHGCPPEEIEKIGRYLIEERNLHTTIKLNPTLLGPDRLRSILNDSLGYEVRVPDAAFEHDLKYADALDLIHSLLASAKKSGVEFGLKLTNTLEVENIRGVLPGDQEMIYMSGRALHPLSVNIAALLQEEFDGRLDISFSAGCDCFNMADVLAAGIRPVTVCTDLLMPGGYTRMGQYLEEIERSFTDAGAKDLDNFILRRAAGAKRVGEAALGNLEDYAGRVVENPAYDASHKRHDSIKTLRPLPRFDCVQAPCINTCAINQDIPDYLYWTARGEYRKAYETILRTNPFPNITGMVCDHLCQSKCTRIHYDNPLLIREIKRFISEKMRGSVELRPGLDNGLKVAIIGAGPSGLACAYFLALDGFRIEVFERKGFAGGMTADAIPGFRLSDEGLRADIESILRLGVKIHYNAGMDRDRFRKLREDFDYVYIAVGAQISKKLNLPGEQAEGIWDQLRFLSAVSRGQRVNLGKRVAVIGGGNSAMDAARTAKRLVGKSGEVTILYRRTRREMPADKDEIKALLDEGVILRELVALESIRLEGGRLRFLICQRMELGEVDDSGRPRPVPVEGDLFELELDGIITAIGQDVELDFLPDDRLRVDPVTNETQYPGVFAGGDAIRGASTLIRAIGDGKRAAMIILDRAVEKKRVASPKWDKGLSLDDFQVLQSRRQYGDPITETGPDERLGFNLAHPVLDEQSAGREAARCLYCNDLCNICVSVCPNRANVAFAVEPVEFRIPCAVRTPEGYRLEDLETFRIEQAYQILNIGDFCNECGNCTTFCPTAGSPWRDKPKFYLTDQSFDQEREGYRLTHDRLLARFDGAEESLIRQNGSYLYENHEIVAKINSDGFIVEDVSFKRGKTSRADFSRAAEMYLLLKALNNHHLFNEAVLEHN